MQLEFYDFETLPACVSQAGRMEAHRHPQCLLKKLLALFPQAFLLFQPPSAFLFHIFDSKLFGDNGLQF